MQFPTLNEISVSRDMIDVFGGYNHNQRINESEFFDMENMTSAYYPSAGVRQSRGTVYQPQSVQGLIAKDNLCWVDGSKFVMGEYEIEMGLSTEPDMCPKTLVSMGAYVVIFPDRKYINTKDITDKGDIDATVVTAGSVSFSSCKMDGSAMNAQYVQAEAPENPENMALWIDTSSDPHTLKQWSSTSSMWVSIATTYVKIYSAGIGLPFEQYDGVTISGLKEGDLHDASTGDVLLQPDDLRTIDGSFVIWSKDDDSIVVVGLLDRSYVISDSITIERKMPLFDFVTESNNRLWACRYGADHQGKIVNEIYASKLGDFKNWQCYMGVATDSYAVSLGSDGMFTGAITHLGYPLFFKEGYLHKIYGNYPANYQVQTTACRGVQQGCHKSLSIVNEVLYYKSPQAICAYDGSLPAEVSAALGSTVYKDAIGGSTDNKYYVSMADASGNRSLFVFDTARGLWHRENSVDVRQFCYCGGTLYFIDGADGAIKAVGTGNEYVKWMLETGMIGATMPDQKYVSRLTMRLGLVAGSMMTVYVQYDSFGDWNPVCSVIGTAPRSYTAVLRPKRCDHFKLRFVGSGDCRIMSITKSIEQGSDIT